MSSLGLLIRPAFFTVGVCGTCFCAVAIAQHENHKSRYQFDSTAIRRRPITVFQDWTRNQQQSYNISGKIIEYRRKVNAWKNSLSSGEKIAFGTIFINALVLGAWRLRGSQVVMTKYFMSHVNTSKIALSPMILSCFSHSYPVHFAFNMYALYSFSNFATALLGPEQLIGLFISAGTVSSFTSISHRLLTGRFVPSLGASGALLGVIAYVCAKQPDATLLLFFIPVAAGHALKGLIALDTVGLFARWSFMDHAAHLGGSLFGLSYALYGEKYFKTHKRLVVDQWMKLKSKYD